MLRSKSKSRLEAFFLATALFLLSLASTSLWAERIVYPQAAVGPLGADTFVIDLRVCAKITWHFGISSSHHLRPLLNREILNVDPATPAVSLNRSRPNLAQI